MATPSSLLNYLPAIYQTDPFLGQFLIAFEKILLGRADGMPVPDLQLEGDIFPNKGLEEKIDALPALFDPQQTPEEFLTWLAGWTAFSLRADIPQKQQRDFISKIISLYRRRGTKENLQQLLEIFTIGKPAIIETEAEEFQIGVHSTIGKDTYLSGSQPHFFRVTVSFPPTESKLLERKLAIAKALIELEKPAHTLYTLEPIFPSMQIGQHSTVGVDTLLGTVPTN